MDKEKTKRIAEQLASGIMLHCNNREEVVESLLLMANSEVQQIRDYLSYNR